MSVSDIKSGNGSVCFESFSERITSLKEVELPKIFSEDLKCVMVLKKSFWRPVLTFKFI